MDEQTVINAFNDLKVEKAEIKLHDIDNRDGRNIESITFSDINYDKLQEHAETMGEGSLMTETVRNFYYDFNNLVEARRMETEGILSPILTAYLLSNSVYEKAWKNRAGYSAFLVIVTGFKNSELTLTDLGKMRNSDV